MPSKDTKREGYVGTYICLEVGFFSVKLTLALSLPSSCLSLLRAEFAEAHHHAGLCVDDAEDLSLAPLIEAVLIEAAG